MNLRTISLRILVTLAGTATFLAIPNAHSAASVVASKNKDGSYALFWAYNFATTDVAKKTAMANCAKKLKKAVAKSECWEAFRQDGPTYVAIVESEPGTKNTAGFGASRDRQSAIDNAYSACVSGGEFQCKNHASSVFWDGGAANLPEPQQMTQQVTTQQPQTLSERVEAARPAVQSDGGTFMRHRYAPEGSALYKWAHGN